MAGASEPGTVSTRQQRLAELAKQSPQMGFTSLAHHLNLEWLWMAFHRTRKDGAVGVDGQTAADYASDDTADKLLSNLESLRERALSGTYRAPPVRRVHIPKGTGPETRPGGIPTFEDKVLQRAVAMLLEPIYEQDFKDCSYGFRPGRSAHQALDAVWKHTMGTQGGWILEVDIKKFFDTLDHAYLRELLKRRVRDGVVLRLIGKWLNAGILEDGYLSYPEAGTPQGGVLSPLLANIYLHYVLDVWFEEEVRPCLQGRAFLIRYADDFIMGFTCEGDARRVLDVLPKRFGRYGLTIHPTKTRLVAFRPPSRSQPAATGAASEPGAFDFLGFTHFWGKSRKGTWVVVRHTAVSRFVRAIKKITQWLRWNRHFPVEEQHQTLWRKLRGHFAYYGITGNSEALRRFRDAVTRLWRKWMSRRQAAPPITWAAFQRFLKRFPLPPAVVVHSVYRVAANP